MRFFYYYSKDYFNHKNLINITNKVFQKTIVHNKDNSLFIIKDQDVNRYYLFYY